MPRIDSSNASFFEKELMQALIDHPGMEPVLDAERLEYISSAGLRVLLSAQKIMTIQGSMVIKGVSEEIAEIFEVTGFNNIFTIE